MASKSKFDIMNGEDAHIIVKETPVHLTDEKIKSILYRTYERAQSDVSVKKWYDYYDCCFSVAGTLFLTLLTASFNKTFGIEPEGLANIARWMLGISLLAGIVFLIFKLKAKRQSDMSNRDIAVEEVFSKYIKCN